MNNLLLVELERKKNVLRNKVAAVDKEYDARRFWISKKFVPSKAAAISGTDGSSNFKKFVGFIVYAANAETLVYDGKMNKVEMCEIDVLRPYRNAEERIRTYRLTLELKCMLKALKEKGLAITITDGSFIGDVIRPPSLSYSLNSEDKERLKVDYLDKLEEACDVEGINLCTKEISEQVFEEFGRKGTDAVVFIEHAESLIAMKKLLSAGSPLVGISKTSQSTDYFEAGTSDLSIFDLACRGSGYTKPIIVKMSDKVRKKFPVYDDFFKSMVFTICFARLSDKGPLLKIEMPGVIEEDDLKMVLDAVSGVSVKGYPHMLKKAHNDVVIKDTDIQKIVRVMGARNRTGREML